MIQFEPNALYTLKELEERLHGLVELPTFLERLGLRDNRVFKQALWGWEILEAGRKAESFSAKQQASVQAVTPVPARGGRGKGTDAQNPVRKLGAGDL
ncbi:hypothetical protein HQ520_00960 [bacterium]|nr:hypothetical protein [bacterium]